MYYLIYFLFLSIKIIISIQNYDEKVSAIAGGSRWSPILPNNSKNSRDYLKNGHSLAKYVVSLRETDKEKDFGDSHFCGGSIIKPDVILTAAHCLFNGENKRSASSIMVAAKTPIRLKKTADSEIISVNEIIIHQNYSSTEKVFDIGILRLKHRIVLDNELAADIKLPSKEVEPTTQCSVLGWGRLYMHGPLANELLYINVSVHSRHICQHYIPNYKNTHICARNFLDREKNPCAGDSGGPLICDGVLTGIVSYGYSCNFGLPAVYTNVYKCMDWIIKNNGKK